MMNIRVAICDDDKSAIEYLENKVKNIELITSVNKFDSIDSFKNAVENGKHYDIVFMDIDWEQEKTGIDFAEELNVLDSGMQVIYVTGYNDRFSQNIFLKKVNLCGFLVKPVQDDLLRNMVNNAVEHLTNNKKEKMVIRHNRDVQIIPYKEIMYMESSVHHVTVHTCNEQITFYGQLEKERSQLPNYFLSSHKSYVVNMYFIKKIEKNKIYLINGKSIDISKSRCSEVRRKFFEYIGGEI